MSSASRPLLLDLLAIGRVSNLPTVWSNVIAGNFLAWALGSPVLTGGLRAGGFGENLLGLAVVLAGTTCAYLFGTYLNDWKDAEFDRAHRPERAIPSGRLSRPAVFRLAMGFAAAALLCFGAVAWRAPAAFAAGLALLVSIAIYTAWHKRSALAIIPMGLCRSLLYLLGFFLVFVPGPGLPSRTYRFASLGDSLVLDPFLVLLGAAAGILCYVAGLTLAARHESGASGTLAAPRAVFWMMILLPFLTHTWWWIWRRPPFLEGWHLAIPAFIGLLPFLLWTVRAMLVLKTSIPGFVSRTLAGLCLVDLLLFPGIAATLDTGTLLDRSSLLLALIPLALFLLALALQRIAPAT